MLNQLKAKIGKFILVQKFEDLARVSPSREFVIDIETTGADNLPGDCSASPAHGIAGIAISNFFGDAMYIQVSDGPNRAGIPIQRAIDFLNTEWCAGARAVIGHNMKFDLSFLIRRGLKIDQTTKIIDTWLLRSIQSEGVFTSNKLKDIIREQFKIETEGKTAVDDWLEANKTRDYGLIPVEIIAPYACQDVIFTLMLLLGGPKPTEDVWANHDLYLRNSLAVNEAESTGICIDIQAMQDLMKYAHAEATKFREGVVTALGATEIDVDDDQVMLKFLHSKNFHSGPRDFFGENKYVFDRDSLLENYDHQLPHMYLNYQDHKMILDCFSSQREMKPRVFKDDTQAGFYPSMLLSVFSKGGIIQCKAPDFLHRLTIGDGIRALFKPRAGSKFVTIHAPFLAEILLAFYSQDSDLLGNLVHGFSPQHVMAERTGFEREACVLLMRQIIEGSGNALLERRLKAAKLRIKGKTHFQAKDTFAAQIMGFSTMRDRIQKALESEGCLRDRLQRRFKVPEDKRWRSHAILIGSSHGSLLSFYFDLFVRAAKATGAKFLIGHENEFVFETGENNTQFEEACRELASRNLIQPQPVWKISSGPKWEKQ